MADIGKGYDFVPGEQVTDVKLDNLSEASVILPSFVTAKTELTVPAGTEYFNVVDTTGAFKKVLLSNIPGASTQPNPPYAVLTPAGGFIDQNCAANKVYQNAKVTISGATTLRINGATNGMFGCIIVAQGGSGNYVLTLPATSYSLGSNGPITTADLSLPVGTGTICSWTYDGVNFYWTFAKMVVGTSYNRAWSTGQSFAHTVAAAVLYNNENWDNDTLHNPAVNPDRFTVQRAGVYLVTAWISWQASNVGQRFANILFNTTTIASVRQQAISQSEMCVTAVYLCAAGDYFQVAAYHDAGVGVNLTLTSTLNIIRVGAF